MAFSTNLVLPMSGAEAYVITMPSVGNTYATVATKAVSAGSWLVAVEITSRSGFNTPSVIVNGTTILGQTGGSAPAGTATVVTGPVTIKVQVRQANSGNVYISKLP